MKLFKKAISIFKLLYSINFTGVFWNYLILNYNCDNQKQDLKYNYLKNKNQHLNKDLNLDCNLWEAKEKKYFFQNKVKFLFQLKTRFILFEAQIQILFLSLKFFLPFYFCRFEFIRNFNFFKKIDSKIKIKIFTLNNK
jgi:hypothetical protein